MRGVVDRRITVFVPNSSGLWRYGTVYDPRIRLFHPWVALVIRTPANQWLTRGVGLSTPYGAVSTREIIVFLPDLLELYMYGILYGPGRERYPPRVRRNSTNPSQSAISQWGWGFHTMRGGIDPGDHRFPSRLVGVLLNSSRVTGATN